MHRRLNELCVWRRVRRSPEGGRFALPPGAGGAGRACLITLVVLLATPIRGADVVSIDTLFQRGEYAACIAAAVEGIAANGVNERVRLLKIRAEMELGQYAQAATSLDAALQALPMSLELRWIGREVSRFNGQPQRVGQLENEIAQLVSQAPRRYSDAGNRIIIGRLLLNQGADARQVLDGTYRVVKQQQPRLARVWLTSGELALDKGDFALAAQDFAKAIQADESEPDAHYGLARAFEPSDSARAEGALKRALECNPRHIPSLLFLAEEQIDSERYDEADKVLDQLAAVNPHHPRGLAFRAVLAHLRHQPDLEAAHRQAALRFWPTNPEVDHEMGRKLSQKYRFAEGADAQRRALEFDPGYLPARMQLAQDLLRLGKEEEGWRLADEVYRADGYNILAHNLVTLQETLSKFRTLEAEGLQLRMDAREAEIYGVRVLDLLQRARRELCAKYDVALETPVIVEVFPRQQDFAIRTFGLPGGDGFLGVCFGTVITANSPASQADHPSCWEATLWHEYCHVITLNKTRNRMPRWLSEGISVYEERQAHPAWGQTMTPRYRRMILEGELTPVSRLSGAFLNPASPMHLQFAYYEASLVVEYLVDQWGFATLLTILDDLGKGLAIHEVLERHAGSVAALDRDFSEYAQRRASLLAPEADWSEPELPRQATIETATAWVRGHPQNYPGLQRLAGLLVADRQWEAAKEPLSRMKRLYPRDAAADGLYALLARVHRELDERTEEQQALEDWVELTAANVAALDRLTELTAQTEAWDATRRYAQRWLAASPLQPAPYRKAALAAEKLEDAPLAIDSYRALLALDPVDPAELHWRLASVLRQTGDLDAARRHALLALEETPRFRPAQRLLVQIARERAKRNQEPEAPAQIDSEPQPEIKP
ncbi:MAG: tetratricopeptide repeat protein [Planctomycetales bacterium]